jgi:hypothetical protein
MPHPGPSRGPDDIRDAGRLSAKVLREANRAKTLFFAQLRHRTGSALVHPQC